MPATAGPAAPAVWNISTWSAYAAGSSPPATSRGTEAERAGESMPAKKAFAAVRA